ncbi:neuropeptides capa receptor [Biomphalaria pfeifferi]|uniref:Neuropeptides capa receptor n=1 Tax=Biomphalaria pfeifferi TaxID=112525 RepID=A0AAD8EV61_BIOPF|nr:neuropeptides capa receptor [Biomphalaria pfeifferi]
MTYYYAEYPTYNDNNTARMVLNAEQRTIIEIINYAFVCGSLVVFGFFSNVINIIIFLRQGLKTTMNISFFGLAVSDVCNNLCCGVWAFFLNPLVENADWPVIAREFEYLISGWPYVYFSRTTTLITAFVTAERCLCITFPLKVKELITPKRATIVVSSIFFCLMPALIPEYATSYIGWKYYPLKNETRLGLIFTENRKSMEGLVFMMNAALGVLSYLLVISFTVLLIWKLKHNSKWRQRNYQVEMALLRDKRAMKMVFLIAVILICCSFPSIVLSIVAYLDHDFSVLGLQSNLFFAMWSFAFAMGSVFSSVNIILYYNMSSKYRRSFREVFLLCSCRKGIDKNNPTSGSRNHLKTPTLMNLQFE